MFLQALRGSDLDVLDLSAEDARHQRSLAAMRSGREVIYQGELRSGAFAGFPDFLVRVEGDSALGAWHYEVWDTKLARHPGESGLSTLDYLLQDQRTIPDDFGIFLARTWRLHPRICSFISGAVYDDRLHSEPVTASRVIRLGSSARKWIHQDAGLLYVPVQHDGNVYESEEEAEQIVQLIDELLRQHLVTESGSERALTHADILVVAPYNLQVRLLTNSLPDIRVGTVDKFQGQQAPVVIYSMCASSGDASSRGIEFLFSKNRLNVAISRAQTLAIFVGHPSLAHTPCSAIEQMQLVNVYCRAVNASASAAVQAPAL